MLLLLLQQSGGGFFNRDGAGLFVARALLGVHCIAVQAHGRGLGCVPLQRTSAAARWPTLVPGRQL